MTTANDATQTIEPASTKPEASREVARELAQDLAWAISVECKIICDALSIGANGQARFAWRELRRIGRVMAKAMEALGPVPGPDGCVVPGPTPRVLQ